MQIDFHYYATYAMARCAGLNQDVAKRVATAAQFVDDNACPHDIEFPDGSSLSVEATAHHVADIANIDTKDQRDVWVPFHFLPGNQGESFTEKLICQKDSEIAKQMLDHYLPQSDKDYYLPLIGIMAHVYADTFSHYGFSGVSSRRNRVESHSFRFRNSGDEVKKFTQLKQQNFFAKYGNQLIRNIKSSVAEDLSGALGHGAVLTYPDAPYLEWRFDYEAYKEEDAKQSGWRDNKQTFLEYCQKMHALFGQIAESNPEYSDVGATSQWSDIENKIIGIIAVRAEKQERIKAWQEAALAGLFNTPETIPEYRDWNSDFDAIKECQGAHEAIKYPLYRFYQAASYHRWYVLRQLLPQHGLAVR